MVFLVESAHKGIAPDRQYLKQSWGICTVKETLGTLKINSHLGLLSKNPMPLNQVPDLGTSFFNQGVKVGKNYCLKMGDVFST